MSKCSGIAKCGWIWIASEENGAFVVSLCCNTENEKKEKNLLATNPSQSSVPLLRTFWLYINRRGRRNYLQPNDAENIHQINKKRREGRLVGCQSIDRKCQYRKPRSEKNHHKKNWQDTSPSGKQMKRELRSVAAWSEKMSRHYGHMGKS